MLFFDEPLGPEGICQGEVCAGGQRRRPVASVSNAPFQTLSAPNGAFQASPPDRSGPAQGRECPIPDAQRPECPFQDTAAHTRQTGTRLNYTALRLVRLPGIFMRGLRPSAGAATEVDGG